MRPKKYDEETKMISFRVPVSKIDGIKCLVNIHLQQYEVGNLYPDKKEKEIAKDEVIEVVPKWKIDAEERMKRNKQ